MTTIQAMLSNPTPVWKPDWGNHNGGVCAHSSAASSESYAIFCVGNDKVREAAFRSWASANGLGFKSLIGCYKGIQEASFIVNQRNLSACAAWFCKEESVLLLGPEINQGGARDATLWFLKDDSKVDLGVLQITSKEHAMRQDAWTYDPSAPFGGAYFTTVARKGS